ncbi:hypothetical protein GCM10028810_51820 [Spirosoma litoris]
MAVVLLLDGCKGCGENPPSPKTGFNITVTDKRTNKPVADASLDWEYRDAILPSENGTGKTDTNGFFETKSENRKPGNYRITVTAKGYTITPKEFTVQADNVASVVIQLEPESPLEITPPNLTFNGNETVKSFYLKNKSDQYDLVINLEPAQKDDWVKFDPTSLKIPAGSQKEVTVTVNRTGRGFGSYNSTAIVNYSQSNLSYNTNLNVYMIIANPQAPTVTTNEPTGVTQNSADVLGTLTNIGGSPVTERGICWSEATDPKPDNSSKASVGAGGLGTFTATARSLKAGTHYFVRSYAINANGTGLGEVKEFTTLVNTTSPVVTIDPVSENTITLNSASVTAMITNNGGSTVIRQGFCINTTGNPTLADKVFEANVDGSGKFGANLTDLSQGLVYYVRAFAINSLGDTKPGYSPVIPFKTQVPITPVKLTTGTATNITETTARVQGNITELGSSPITQHGFCWSRQSAMPDINNAEKNQLGTKADPGAVSANLSNLKKGALYYLRIYTTSNDGKTVYGNVQTFVTKEQGLVVFYPFNGDASDASYNGNNALATAKLTEDKNGNSQSAYDLSAGKIQVQNATVGRFTSDFTYSFWVKINASAFTGSQKVLLSKGYKDDCFGFESATWGGFMIFTDPTNNSLSLFVAGTDKMKTKVKLADGTSFSDSWHHVVITKTGTSVNCYLNSLIANTNSVTTSTIGGYLTNNSTIYEGQLTLSGFSYEATKCQYTPVRFVGSIDNFRFYSYGLSDDDVKDLYDREK